jgi:TetR/AcrR family transcriptional regulator, mexJK operon transcriptional repressor
MDTHPRPGRPKSSAKRSAIVAAAQRRFTQEPYDRVSLDEIAADADVSKVTIYAHFPNKEALFVAAISASCEAVFENVDISAPVSGPVDDVLYRLGCDFLGMIFDPGIDRLHAVIVTAGQAHPELPQLYYDSVVRRSKDVLAAYLRAQTENGTLSIDDTQVAAVQFLALIQGEFRYRVELGLALAHRDEMAIYVRACVTTLLRAWRDGPRA